jgi:hypothetical protein
MKRRIFNILKMANEEPTETVSSVGGVVDGFAIFEMCKPDSTQPLVFAYKTIGEATVFTSEVQHRNAKKLYKPTKSVVPWALPTEPEMCKDTETLWNEVESCLKAHIDLADAESYNVLTAWILASWLLERWTVAPYLFFFGSFGTGKTRCLEVLSKLCSRGWLALYVTPANLFRPLQQWKPTLFLDEAEIYGDKSEILGLLNGSYRKGQYVARQKGNDGEYETEFFDCFGFKAIAGTKDLAKTLRSRCIIFQTTNATRKIKFFVDEKWCTELRNKLLAWRFCRMLEGTEGTEDISETLEGLVQQIGNQRETELFYPLVSVSPNREITNKLINYAKTSASRKLEEMSLTAESTCLGAILAAKQRGKIENGRLLIQDITATANENLAYEEQWKERFTSSLCSRLGFQKSRGTKGKAVILWSEPLIERLRKDARYSLVFEQSANPNPPFPSGQPSESSVPSNSRPINEPFPMKKD